jgi:hypothetical protein
MPTLSPKRTVRYSAADCNALASAVTLAEFAGDFDRDCPKDRVTRLRSELEWLAGYIEAKRNGSPTPAESGK